MSDAWVVAIVDDHPVVRTGVANALIANGFSVCCEAGDGEELLGKLASKCDLVLVDLSMPGMDGIQLIRAVKASYPGVRVVVMSMTDDAKTVRRALAAGADGFFSKDDQLDVLPSMLTSIMQGHRAFSPRVQSVLADLTDIDPEPQLTRREQQVLELVAEGLSQKQIADDLGIAVRTVEFHKANIKEKLQINTLAELIRYGQSQVKR